MVERTTGTARLACVVTVTRRDLQTLMRQGWVIIGDGEDRRGETRRERRERRRASPDVTEMSPRERDPGIEAAETNAELSAMLFLNGAERENDPDLILDFETYVRLNITLNALYRLLDGAMIRWGERYGRPLYVDSEGVDTTGAPSRDRYQTNEG